MGGTPVTSVPQKTRNQNLICAQWCSAIRKSKMAKNEVTAKDSSLPAHLQGGKKARFGNTDSSDLIIPRIVTGKHS